MRRIVVGVLVLLLALTGCSQVLGTAEWDRIEATFTVGDEMGVAGTGDHTLVVTPTELSYSTGGKETTQALPEGAWATLTTGVRAFGDRKAVECTGSAITITASAKSTVKQTFAANACDAGEAFDQATALVEQIIAQIK